MLIKGKWLDTRALRAQCIFQESETQLKEFLQVNNGMLAIYY